MTTRSIPGRKFGFISILVVFLALGLSHARLYSLWDDEANTLLLAQGVRETGDTTAKIGHLLIAYRNGAELEFASDGSPKARYVSPLQYYFVAPWIESFPQTTSPLRVRFPFLLCWWICTIGLFIRYRMIRYRNSTEAWQRGLGWLVLLTLLAPTWTLFGVQARYYSLTLLFSGLSLELILYRFRILSSSSTHSILIFGGLGFITSLLFISHYLIGVAWITTLAMTLLGASRRHAGFAAVTASIQSFKNITAFLIPHLLISIPCFLIWNPLGKPVVEQKNTWFQKLKLFYWNLRDLNGTQMAVWVTLLGLGFWLARQPRPSQSGTPILKNSVEDFRFLPPRLIDAWSELSFRDRHSLFLMFILFYTFIVAVFSPQPVAGTNVADVRYLYPLMWITLPYSAFLIHQLYQRSKLLAGAWVLIFQASLLTQNGTLRMPLVDWIREQKSPAIDPYRDAGELITQHIAPLARPFLSPSSRPFLSPSSRPFLSPSSRPTLAVSTDYAVYPLMTQYPDLQYVDQLKSEWEQAGTPGLQPEWVLTFCQPQFIDRFGGHRFYKKIAQKQSTCKETFRPELFWRSFGTTELTASVSGVIELFQRKPRSESL